MGAEVSSMAAGNQLLRSIGNTPLVELMLGRSATSQTRLFAKLESANPGGSIRDRPVARMLLQAAEDNRFENGRGVLACVSGNAGISFAMLGAAMGIGVTLIVSGHASREQLDRMAAHGAEVVVMDPFVDDEAMSQEAQRLIDAFPMRYWLCDQCRDPANWQAHYYGTATEVLEQLEQYPAGLADAFVVGVDTGGTLTGMGRKLREANPNIHIAAVIPEGFPGMEGLKPLDRANDAVSGVLTQSLVHERIPVTLNEACWICHRLAREGLFVGPVAGAYVQGALRLAATDRYRNIVTVLPDAGERCISNGMRYRSALNSDT